MAYRNAPIPVYLRSIYFLFRVIAWIGGLIFYRRRLRLGALNARFDGPAIVVANHPSTLMDVLNTGIYVHQEMFFLANYGLFKTPLTNWLFRRLFCIPVKRREDVAEGEARNNDAAFEQSFLHLEKNGVLFIAPEGESWMHRVVRPFKTGTARIALATEARNGWALGLKIIPVGLTYSAADRFRSEAVINFGEPVAVRDWAGAHQAGPEKAVDDLTDHLQARVSALTIDGRDEAGDLFLARLEEVLQNSQPLPPHAAFARGQALAKKHLADAELRRRVDDYFAALAAAGLTDGGFFDKEKGSLGGRQMGRLMLLALGTALFVAGYALWWLPCFLPWLLNRKLGLYVGYSSTVKILTAFLVWPLYFWGLSRLLCPALLALLPFANLPVALCFLFLLTTAMGLGFFVEIYQGLWLRYREARKASLFGKKDLAGLVRLAELREAVFIAYRELPDDAYVGQ